MSPLPISIFTDILNLKYRRYQYRYFTAALLGLLILQEVEKVPNVFAFNIDDIIVSRFTAHGIHAAAILTLTLALTLTSIVTANFYKGHRVNDKR